MKYAQAFIKSQLPDVNVIKILFFLMSDIFANKAKCVAFYVQKKWVQSPLKFSVRKIFEHNGNI